jgi:hypothetical protein
MTETTYDYFKLHEEIRKAFCERNLILASELINDIRNEEDIQYALDLSFTNVDNYEAIETLASLNGKTSVTTLNLSSNNLNIPDDLEGLSVLAGSSIKQINFDANNINAPEQIAAIANAIENTDINRVSLIGNNIKESSTISALYGLVMTNVTTLDLSNNKVNTIEAITALNSLAGSDISMILFSGNKNNTPDKIMAFQSLSVLAPNNIKVEIGCDDTGNQDNLQAMIDLQTNYPNITVLEYPIN